MNKEDLVELKEKIANLSEEEQKQRDLYLKGLADGTLQGPPVGYPSVDKPWLKFYSDEGILKDIPKESAYSFIYNNNKNHLNDIALEYLGRKITYKEFFENVEKTAKAFLSKGVKAGDIITMGMATTPEMVYILYALNRIGAITNAIDPRLTSEEIKEKMIQSKSKFFIGLDMCTDKVKTFSSELNIDNIVEVSPFESASKFLKIIMLKKINKSNWNDFIKDGFCYSGLIDNEFVSNSPIVILYTGGTTGPSKGVILTNENLNTMALTQVISDFNVERGDSFLNFLPPFSAYSIVNAIQDPLYMGFRTILVPQFKPTDFPKLMKKYKPNHVLSGPILWEILMNDKKYNKMNLSFLKSPISGGDSMKAEFEKKLNKFLKDNGCKYNVQQGYGMTEVSAAASYSSEKSYSLGSVGVPYIKNVISSFNPETGEELGFNQEGEIRISTPTMMKGYQNNSLATDEIISYDVDGKRWIKTGDVGKIDENGNLFISGRMKRLIVRSGNKIFPLNVENIIMSLNEIENICIVGMEDKIERHVPVAFVVLKDEYKGMEEEITLKIENIVKSSLPEFCLPTKFIYRDKLPLTDMTKVDFKELELESEKYINDDNKIFVESMLSIKK